jgi:hypothetical protein
MIYTDRDLFIRIISKVSSQRIFAFLPSQNQISQNNFTSIFITIPIKQNPVCLMVIVNR